MLECTFVFLFYNYSHTLVTGGMLLARTYIPPIQPLLIMFLILTYLLPHSCLLTNTCSSQQRSHTLDTAILCHVSEASLQLPAVLWSTDLSASSPNGVCAVCPYPCDHSPRPKPEWPQESSSSEQLWPFQQCDSLLCPVWKWSQPGTQFVCKTVLSVS